MTKITVREFEDKVRAIEEVTIVIRAPAGTEVDDYDFQRCTAGSTTVKDWLDTRIKPRVGSLEVEIITADYIPSIPHGRMKMGTLRDQYSR